jgi:hypothetical protein
VSKHFGPARLAGLLVCVAGCHDSPTFHFEGDWLGHRKGSVEPGVMDPVKVSQGEVEVQIHVNGRFDLGDHGLDYSGPQAYDGGVAVLIPDTVEGRPLDRQPDEVRKRVPTVRLRPNSDGQTLTETETLTGTRGSSEAVVLKRQKP